MTSHKGHRHPPTRTARAACREALAEFRIKHQICLLCAIENINQNASQAGCTPPAHGHWTEYDTIAEWGVNVEDLAIQYLEDGTASHYCD
jgi:hypothetical protein